MSQEFSERMEKDGFELTNWYERLPDMATWYRDERIAAELGWYKGGEKHPKLDFNKLQKLGDAARVRRTRRYVDRDEGFFKGYHFGTRENGSGRSQSNLNTPHTSKGDTALDVAVAAQIRRAIQAADQHGIELERAVGKLYASRDEYVTAGAAAKAFWCQDAIREIETTRMISKGTLTEGLKLGIPVESFGRWVEA